MEPKKLSFIENMKHNEYAEISYSIITFDYLFQGLEWIITFIKIKYQIDNYIFVLWELIILFSGNPGIGTQFVLFCNKLVFNTFTENSEILYDMKTLPSFIIFSVTV